MSKDTRREDEEEIIGLAPKHVPLSIEHFVISKTGIGI